MLFQNPQAPFFNAYNLPLEYSPAAWQAGEHAALHHSPHQALCTQLRFFVHWTMKIKVIHSYTYNYCWRRETNLFLWYSCSASISFIKGKALAAGIIWQRMSWTGAWSETARFTPGRSLWSLLIPCMMPTYRRLKASYTYYMPMKYTLTSSST